MDILTNTIKTVFIMLISIVYFVCAIITIQYFGYTAHLLAIPIGFFVWTMLKEKVKLSDESIHYIIALVFCAMHITVASLSIDEIKTIIPHTTFETYLWLKIISNMTGWTFLPIVITNLINTTKNKDKK